MKKILMCLIICVFGFLLVGCGNKEVAGNNNDYKENINDNTKVKTIAASYEKYTALKSNAYDMLNKAMEESDNYNFSLSMGLLGFATLDLTLIPVSFCGLDKETTYAGLGFLYSNIDYENNKDGCRITFTSDESQMTYNMKYDEKTDSVQTKVYENDQLSAISEYVKLDDGYATQFYSITPDETKVYKSIFDNKRIILGVQTGIDEPDSIFKNSNIADEEWTKSQEIWSKYEKGKVTSIYNGEEY